MFTDRRIVALLLAVAALAAEKKPEHTDLYGDPLPQGAIARMGTVRLRQYQITQVAFSPDGKLLASSGWDGMVRVWDEATQKEIHVFAAHQGYHGCFAFASDGKGLVAGGSDRTIRYWDLATGKQLRAFQVSDAIHKFAVSSNGKLLATIGGKTTRIWDAATCKEILTLTAPQGAFHSLAFSPDGKALATGGSDEKAQIVWLWNVVTGKEMRVFRARQDWGKRSISISPIQVYSVAFSADGKRLATAGDDAVRVWEVASAKQCHVFEPNCQNRCVAFAPDGQALASTGFRNQMYLWDTVGGKEILHRELPSAEVRSIAFSPDGKRLATGDLDRVRLWDARTGQPSQAPRGHSSPVCSLAYSPDGKLLATGSDDKTVRLWDVASAKETRIFQGHQSGVSSVSFSPNGQTLASGGRDQTLRLWDVATGKTLRTFRSNDWITSVAYSPNGKLVATGELYNVLTSVRLWEPSSGKEMPVVFRHDLSIHSVAFSPDGKQLLISGNRHFNEFHVRLLDVTTGKIVRALPELQHEVYSVAFSPDGRVFATGSDDKTARLWETDSGRQIHKLPHDEDLRSVAFSPDGALLASGGWGRKVHLWDVLTGKEMHVFRGHRGAIFSVAFSPDGRTLASAGRDASCLVWDAAVPFRTEPPGDRLSDRRRKELWATLGGTDALAAWRATYALVAGSEQNVPFLDRHLQTPLIDPQQLQRWIADLDSDSFVVREKARKELEQQGEVAAPALQQALREKPSLEARKQMERLLADAPTRVPRGEFLAMLRALTVLERIGTAAARQALEKLARGNPLDRRTREAKAALRRLAARSDTMP